MTDEQLRRQTEQAAQSWLAEFAPLLKGEAVFDEAACRARLEVVSRLRLSGPQLLTELSSMSPSDISLPATFHQAWAVIDRVDDDLRRQLARLAPGAPEGRVDLEALRGRIAHLAAQQEVGVSSPPIQGRLDLTVGSVGRGRPRALIAVYMGVALSISMLFGLSHGLVIPPYIPIFFAALVVMLLRLGRQRQPSRFSLEGRKLTVYQPMWADRIYQLGPESRAYAGSVTVSAGEYARNEPAILIVDATGHEVTIPVMQSQAYQEELVKRVNSYLAAQGSP